LKKGFPNEKSPSGEANGHCKSCRGKEVGDCLQKRDARCTTEGWFCGNGFTHPVTKWKERPGGGKYYSWPHQRCGRGVKARRNKRMTTFGTELKHAGGGSEKSYFREHGGQLASFLASRQDENPKGEVAWGGRAFIYFDRPWGWQGFKSWSWGEGLGDRTSLTLFLSRMRVEKESFCVAPSGINCEGRRWCDTAAAPKKRVR